MQSGKFTPRLTHQNTKMRIKGQISLPGDKSISHRALLLASLSDKDCTIKNISSGEDIISSMDCLNHCGIKIEIENQAILVHGDKLKHALLPLNCGNSGTSARLLSGLLAGQKISASLIGDSSLSNRPMNRVINPLVKMGADITSLDGLLPIHISPANLNAISYTLPVASAQVKSAILFAGLGADGQTSIIEPVKTRDHTENMFKHLDLPLSVDETHIKVNRLNNPVPQFNIRIPGDPSSAAFFTASVLLLPESEVIFTDLLLNQTRTGFFKIIQSMGANVEILNKASVMGESIGDVKVNYKLLSSIELGKNDIPAIIDELPLLAVLATQAEGTTKVHGAEELRVKESDRIHAVCTNLSRMGADITELRDGFIINGPTKLNGSDITTFGDHRIAMTFTIAGLISDGDNHLDDEKCIATSFPEFHQYLDMLIR